MSRFRVCSRRGPPRCAVPQICVYVYVHMKLTSFVRCPACLVWPRTFSRALGYGARQGPSYVLTAQVWAPAGLRGACSGRSKCLELASNHGIAFRQARTNQVHGKPHKSPAGFVCFAVCNSSRLRGSHVTTAASLQAFPFVAATNDASACVRACLSVSHRTYRMVYHKTL